MRRIVTAMLATMVWPAAAIVSLSIAVGGPEVTWSGLVLAALGAASAYGLDRLIDRRDLDPLPVRRALIVGVALASAGTGVMALTDMWRIKVCLLLAVIAGAYVPLKKIFPKNVLTTLAWTTAVALLPFPNQPHADATFGASVLAVALIMAANTIACDIPDVRADREAGVRGITPRYGASVGAAIAALCGSGAAIVAGCSGHWGLAVTGLCLVLLALRLARNPDQRRYRAWADAAVTLIPGPVALFFR